MATIHCVERRFIDGFSQWKATEKKTMAYMQRVTTSITMGTLHFGSSHTWELPLQGSIICVAGFFFVVACTSRVSAMFRLFLRWVVCSVQ